MQDLQQEFLRLLAHEELVHEPFNLDLELEELQAYFGKNCEFVTLILEEGEIDRNRFDNERFFNMECERQDSQIRQEAYRLMRNYFNNNYEWLDKIIEQYYPKETTEITKWYEEHDNYFECVLQSFYPEALDALSHMWAFEQYVGREEEFDEAAFNEIIRKYTDQWLAYRNNLFLPIYEDKYYLNYELILPTPLSYFNHGCGTKQFYFIKNGRTLHVTSGCGCDFATRHQHDLFAHYFALLEEGGYQVKSFLGEITDRCEFLISRKSDKLIVLDQDLTCSYQIDKEASDALFSKVEKYLSTGP